MSTPKHSTAEEECKDLISNLPREKGWYASQYMYLYQGFWYPSPQLQALISCQSHHRAHPSDVLLVTNPKSGTTWFKAIIFSLLNRTQHPVIGNQNHPLLSRNPHDVVLSLEFNLYADNQIPDIASFPSPAFFSTHIPYPSLPESSRSSRIVYVARSIKDTFISLWHFMNKLRLQQSEPPRSMEEDFEMFASGLSLYGPFWDHALQYWKRSREDPGRVLFLRYEDMKERPGVYLRRLAEFLGCGFTAEEEELGMVENIIELTSFERMSGLEVNKKGVLLTGFENRDFFRRGEVGDWKNHLSPEMAEKIDRISEEKFAGSGLVL